MALQHLNRLLKGRLYFPLRNVIDGRGAFSSQDFPLPKKLLLHPTVEPVCKANGIAPLPESKVTIS